jgi:hypothetical protein
VTRKLLDRPRRRLLDEERRYEARLLSDPLESDVELFI